MGKDFLLPLKDLQLRRRRKTFFTLSIEGSREREREREENGVVKLSCIVAVVEDFSSSGKLVAATGMLMGLIGPNWFLL